MNAGEDWADGKDEKGEQVNVPLIIGSYSGVGKGDVGDLGLP